MLLLVAVAAAKELRTIVGVQDFIRHHPGTGFAIRFMVALPAWVRVQHFFNLLLMTFIIRAGLQILADHPRLYWTRHWTPGKEWFRANSKCPTRPCGRQNRTRSASEQVGLPGIRHSIGLARWWHLGTDTLLVVNGIIFYVLLFVSGSGAARPDQLEVIPNAGRSGPVLVAAVAGRHGWVAYNGLQIIAYFITVFIAAPLDPDTGLGMSPALSTRFRRVSSLSIQSARSLHFLVMSGSCFSSSCT